MKTLEELTDKYFIDKIKEKTVDAILDFIVDEGWSYDEAAMQFGVDKLALKRMIVMPNSYPLLFMKGMLDSAGLNSKTEYLVLADGNSDVKVTLIDADSN